MTTIIWGVLGVILVGAVIIGFVDARLKYRVAPDTSKVASKVHDILTTMMGIAIGIVMANGFDMFKF